MQLAKDTGSECALGPIGIHRVLAYVIIKNSGSLLDNGHLFT
jgi:hypothetical protein